MSLLKRSVRANLTMKMDDTLLEPLHNLKSYAKINLCCIPLSYCLRTLGINELYWFLLLIVKGLAKLIPKVNKWSKTSIGRMLYSAIAIVSWE